LWRRKIVSLPQEGKQKIKKNFKLSESPENKGFRLWFRGPFRRMQ